MRASAAGVVLRYLQCPELLLVVEEATTWAQTTQNRHTRPSGQGRLQGGREPAAYLQNCPGGSLAAPGRPGCPCTAGLLLLLALSMLGRTRPFSAYPIPKHRRGAGVYTLSWAVKEMRAVVHVLKFC
jgi:hypothetical protein